MNKDEALQKWMDGKRYYRIFSTRGSNLKSNSKIKLAYRDILIYSYISFRTSKKQKTSLSIIQKIFCFDFNCIKKSISTLKELGLITIEGKRYIALEPQGKIRDSFIFADEVAGHHWYDRMIKYKLFLVNKKIKKNGLCGRQNTKPALTMNENIVFWKLISLSKIIDENTMKKNYQKQSGLAELCMMSQNGVANSLRRLEDMGLISKEGKGYLVYKPKNIDYWQDKKQKEKIMKKEYLPVVAQKKEVSVQALKKEVIPQQQNGTLTQQNGDMLTDYLFNRIGRNDIDEYVCRMINSVGIRIMKKMGIARKHKDFQKYVRIYQYILDRYPTGNIDESQLFHFLDCIESIYYKAERDNQSGTALNLFDYYIKSEIK